MVTINKVLVVDDEAMITRILEKKLTRSGFVVKCATGGIEALSMCGKENFDLVISDICMPLGDGVTLLKNLRQRSKDSAKVILMSGFTSLTEDEAHRLGALALVTKPFSPAKIVAMIDELKCT